MARDATRLRNLSRVGPYRKNVAEEYDPALRSDGSDRYVEASGVLEGGCYEPSVRPRGSVNERARAPRT